MNLKKAKITLDKINALYKSMSLSNHPVSNVERDLMLSYVRELYESVLDTSSIQEVPEPRKPATNSQPEFEVVLPGFDKKYEAPKIIEIQEQLEEPAPKQSQPLYQAPPPPVKETLPPPPPPAPPIQVPAYNREIEQLFDQKKATELSEKLSESPIADLTRAMSINDRLLYMNELFGKDIEALNESLKLLNKYESITQAKGLLANLADQYNWMKEDKIDVARAFIKLVRRRYI